MAKPKSIRLANLMAHFTNDPRPVTGKDLMFMLDVGKNRLARDIAHLIGEGVPIIGDARKGYTLHPGHAGPPLRFDLLEARAVLQGLTRMSQAPDPDIAMAARAAQHKTRAALTMEERDQAMYLGLFQFDPEEPGLNLMVTRLRNAIRDQVIVAFDYLDVAYKATHRRVKPVALTWAHGNITLVAWCELRGAFRNFRLDRLAPLTVTTERYRPTHARLLADWRATDSWV
jgi:predicted DNA-binding transcriptional regulator YafY